MTWKWHQYHTSGWLFILLLLIYKGKCGNKLMHFLSRWVSSILCQSIFSLSCSPGWVRGALLLPAALHHGFVLAHTQSPAFHNACALRPGFVLVVGVALQVLPAQPGLLLIVRLLLLVRHGLPAWAYRGKDRDTNESHSMETAAVQMYKISLCSEYCLIS